MYNIFHVHSIKRELPNTAVNRRNQSYLCTSFLLGDVVRKERTTVTSHKQKKKKRQKGSILYCFTNLSRDVDILYLQLLLIKINIEKSFLPI